MHSQRELVDLVYRNSFVAFAYKGFAALYQGRELIPAGHADAIAFHLQQMYEGAAKNRLVINCPPRTLKTFLASIALVAWLLGRDPTLQIICASYAEDLSHYFSRETRSLME